LSRSPDIETCKYGSKDPETVKNYRQNSRQFTLARRVMGTVVSQDHSCCGAVNYYEALNKHPVGGNGLRRVLMATFAR